MLHTAAVLGTLIRQVLCKGEAALLSVSLPSGGVSGTRTLWLNLAAPIKLTVVKPATPMRALPPGRLRKTVVNSDKHGVGPPR